MAIVCGTLSLWPLLPLWWTLMPVVLELTVFFFSLFYTMMQAPITWWCYNYLKPSSPTRLVLQAIISPSALLIKIHCTSLSSIFVFKLILNMFLNLFMAFTYFIKSKINSPLVILSLCSLVLFFVISSGLLRLFFVVFSFVFLFVCVPLCTLSLALCFLKVL